jgi:hypothetical protein
MAATHALSALLQGLNLADSLILLQLSQEVNQNRLSSTFLWLNRNVQSFALWRFSFNGFEEFAQKPISGKFQVTRDATIESFINLYQQQTGALFQRIVEGGEKLSNAPSREASGKGTESHNT